MKRPILFLVLCLFLALFTVPSAARLAAQETTPVPEQTAEAQAGIDLPQGIPPSPAGRAVITPQTADALGLIGRLGSGRFTRIDIAPSGEYVAMQASNGIYVFTLDDNGAITPAFILRHDDFLLDLAWSADGALIAVLSIGGLVTVHDTADQGRAIASETFSGVTSLAFHPAAPALALGAADRALIWNYQTNATLDLPGIDFFVSTLAFSADGVHLLVGGGTTIVRFDNLVEALRNDALPGSVFAIAYSPVTRDTVLLGMQGMADIIRREGDASIEIPFRLNEQSVRAIAFMPDGGRVVEGWTNGIVYVRDAVEGGVLHQLSHDGPIRSVDVAPDGTIWSFDQTSTLYQWNPDTGTLIGRFPVGPISYTSVAVAPDGRTAAAGSLHDRSIYLFDLTTLDDSGTLVDGRGVRTLAWSSSGGLLASVGVDDAVINVYDMTTRARLGRVNTPHTGPINAVVFNADDSLLATGGQDGRLLVFDLANGSARINQEFGVPIASLTFTPDNRLLIIGLQDRRILLVNTGDWSLTGEVVAPFQEPLRSVAVDGSGRLLLAGGGVSGNWFTLNAPETPVFNPAWTGLTGRTAALSPDGRMFALASPREIAETGDDVRVFSFVEDGVQPIASLQSPTSLPTALTWTPDLTLLLVSTIDGYIDVYGLN